jgi:hypothetical protein
MLTHPFRHAVLTLTDWGVLTVFDDGTQNEMHFSGVNTPEQRMIAHAMGYGDDWRRYTVEHDITHCWLADRLWKPWSLALHDPLDLPIDLAPEAYRREEHMVNCLQRLTRGGATDPYDVLQSTFGDQLGIAVIELRAYLAEAG